MSTPEKPKHPYGYHADGTPLTKSGRKSRNYVDQSKPPKPKGRPTKASLVKHKNKGIIGRPKGTATIINEYRDRMLASPKSAKVLDAIFNAALDDDHKHQASAWKLVMDRVAPIAAFEKEITKGSGKSAIQINITGIGGTTVEALEPTDEADSDISDAEYTIV